MDDLSRFCCLNSDCPEHGKRGAGNLTVTSRYGPGKERRMLRCRRLQDPLLRAEGDTPVRLPAAAGEGRIGPGAHRRGVRRPTDRPALQGEPRHGRPSEPDRRVSTPATFTTNWSPFSPRTRVRSSSMRSGRSSPRRRRTATHPTRPTTARGTAGTTSRSIPSIAWSSASCPASGRPRTSRRWSRTSSAAPAGRLMGLITTDGYPAYETAILDAYGETVTPPRTGKRGVPGPPYKVAPPGLTYAVVEKTREKGRVVKIATRVVFGTVAAVMMAALGLSSVSRAINTAFVERQNGTDRHRNARKARKTYRFSKDWRHHEAVTYLSLYIYNFCWPVRTLADRDDRGRLADHGARRWRPG